MSHGSSWVSRLTELSLHPKLSPEVLQSVDVHLFDNVLSRPHSIFNTATCEENMERDDNGRYVNRRIEEWRSSSAPWQREYHSAVDSVRAAVEPLTLPEAAKLLAAMSTDFVAAVQQRNNRPDVNDAFAALRVAVALLGAIEGSLDG
jgi:hypothetical protein